LLSSALIANNRQRLAKELQASPKASKGSRPAFLAPKDEKDEARQIVDAIEDGFKEGLAWQDMAVIYRLNNQAFLIQHELAKRNIPFRILGGEPRILNHWIAKGLMGYLEAALTPGNAELLFYIINRPSRYINKQAIASAEMLALQGVEPLEALRRQPINEAGLKVVGQLAQDLAQITALKAQAAFEYVRVKVGFDGFIQGIAQDFRLDYEELEQIADTVCYLPDTDESVDEFVRRIPELRTVGRWTRETNGVTLTTCHSAKGLEYKYVILAGTVEGTLPYAKSLTSRAVDKLEEERRLAYVAVTRSENMLLISSPKTMRGKSVAPSRFIGEMRQGILHKEIVAGALFDHPSWGRCTWGSSDGEVASITRPDGEVKRISIAWLRDQNII
jgi:DNA helicase-2/ATP-dependent DNA helicase PcrA